MTETAFAAPRLERPTDRTLTGACAAVARATGTSVVLWRVLVVVLSFFGGAGIFLYLVAVATIPSQGQPQSLAQRLWTGPDRHLSGRNLALIVLLLLAFGGLVNDSDGLLVAAVLGGLAVLFWRSRGDRPALAPMAPPAPFEPAPPRPRSPLTALTSSAVVVLVGTLVLLDATGTVDVTAEVALAAALALTGVGLVAGSFFGRSWWLVALAAVLGLALAGTAAARPVVEAGVGERTWTPVGSASYRLGVGEATLDLRDVAVRESGTIGIDARLEVGHLVVLLPEDVRVALDARAGMGHVDLLGEQSEGHKVVEHLETGPEGDPQLRVDLSVRTGEIDVRRG